LIDLVVAWSGELEASGAVPGLSSYQGRSSLYHSANWERPESGEAKELSPGTKKARGHDRRTRAKYGSLDADVLAMLKKGASYGAISRRLDCSYTLPRNVARRNGIDRRAFSHCPAHRLAVAS
jgi:hypothetical protein